MLIRVSHQSGIINAGMVTKYFKRVLIYSVILGSLFAGLGLLRFLPGLPLPPELQSESLNQLTSNNPELFRLVTVLDYFKDGDHQVIYDGLTLDAEWAWRQGRDYLAKNINELTDAETWIRTHAYQTSQGNVISFKYPDGTERPMRDVLLEKLNSISNAAEEKIDSLSTQEDTAPIS